MRLTSENGGNILPPTNQVANNQSARQSMYSPPPGMISQTPVIISNRSRASRLSRAAGEDYQLQHSLASRPRPLLVLSPSLPFPLGSWGGLPVTPAFTGESDGLSLCSCCVPPFHFPNQIQCKKRLDKSCHASCIFENRQSIRYLFEYL